MSEMKKQAESFKADLTKTKTELKGRSLEITDFKIHSDTLSLWIGDFNSFTFKEIVDR